MCEEAHSNQVKEKEKNASWETDVNNGPGNGRSKLRSRAPVCFHAHPGLAIKHARVALQRGGAGGGDARKWLRPILRIPCHYPHVRERRQVQHCLPGKGTSRTKMFTSEGTCSGQSHLVKHRLYVFIKEPFPYLFALNGTERSNLKMRTVECVCLRAFK